MTPPLLIFDCDGVLLDTEAIYIDVELAFLKSLGVTVERDWYMHRFMALAQDTWRAKYCGLILERTGIELSDEGFERLKDESRRRVLAELKPVAGAEAMLSRLTGDRCVASSTRLAFLHRKLEQVNFSRFFGGNIFSGDQVAHGKPAPDLFLFAAEQVNHAPGDCIVIEDSANGVTGGKAAGQYVIGFTGGTHCPDGHGEALLRAGADLVIGSHDELSDWFTSQLRAA